MVVVRLDSNEHEALCGLVRERCRQYDEIISLEESKRLENDSTFNLAILRASRKARIFKLAYESLLDSLMRYESAEK